MELESGQQPNRALRGPPAPWFDHPASWFLLLCASFAGLVLLAPYFENLAGPARLAAWFVGLLAVALFARRAFSKGAAGRARAMSAADAAVGRLPGLGESGDRKDIEEQLRRLAFHDPLTLLANRALFRDRVEHALAVSKRSDRGVAMLFIDLDDFKSINDSFGHSEGDRVLSASAQRLIQCTRSGDTVARLGGDEFAVLLENLTSRDPVVEIAGRVVAALREPFPFLASDQRISASIGVAFATPEDGVEELLRNADVAMYSAKSQGKGRFAVFVAEMPDVANMRMQVEAELAQALVAGQFQIHYQPIVELRSGYLLGVEALVRWRHPQRGLVSPAEFLGIAEGSGQMIALGRWVLQQACAEVKTWQSRLPEGRQMRLAVNVSVGQLRDPDLVADVTQALARSQLDPGCLVIEVTESVLMHNTESMLAKLNS